MRSAIVKALLSVSTFAILAPAACGGQQANGAIRDSSYDGRWWLSASSARREGFLAGYFDCYHFEYKGPDRYLTKSYQRYEHLLSAAYADSANLERSLSEVIHSLRDKPGDADQSVGGQPARGEHWGNDGLYWRQASNGGHDEQLGFVEGYLFCHEKLARNRGGAFSKSPEQYRRLITEWYKFDEQTDEIDPKREPVAIADVLFKVRTGAR